MGYFWHHLSCLPNNCGHANNGTAVCTIFSVFARTHVSSFERVSLQRWRRGRLFLAHNPFLFFHITHSSSTTSLFFNSTDRQVHSFAEHWHKGRWYCAPLVWCTHKSMHLQVYTQIHAFANNTMFQSVAKRPSSRNVGYTTPNLCSHTVRLYVYTTLYILNRQYEHTQCITTTFLRSYHREKLDSKTGTQKAKKFDEEKNIQSTILRKLHFAFMMCTIFHLAYKSIHTLPKLNSIKSTSNQTKHPSESHMRALFIHIIQQCIFATCTLQATQSFSVY